jgi:hypothetical protein
MTLVPWIEKKELSDEERCLSKKFAAEREALFSAAGFLEVPIFEKSTKGWICVTGKKASDHARSFGRRDMRFYADVLVR